jgi:tetratricopeptide (TPR) repeat protein
LYLTLSEADGEIRQLVDQFRELFDRATQPETRVFVGFAAARHARDSLQNTTTARALVEKVLALAPESDVALLLLAELLVEARAWPEATERLEAVARLTTDSERKLRALVGLARIYETVLPAPDERERILRALVVVDAREPKHANALAAHLIARASTAEAPLALTLRREASQLLESVVPLAADMTGRARALVAVAKGRELLGELDAADAALGQALALSPDPERFVAGLESGVRDPRRLANVLGAANRFDGAEGREPPAERLQRLGMILLARCGDAAAAIAPLRASLVSRGGTAEARAALVEACARVQLPEEAVDAGLPLVYPTPDSLLALADPETPLRTLSQALIAIGRGDEARPLGEVLGDELSLPRTPIDRPAEAPLPRTALHGLVPSPEPLLSVVLAMQGLETKLLRGDLTEVGVAPREKISARIGHPLRTAMERLLRPFGAPPFEMVVSDVLTAPRVIQQDEPWILLPSRLSSDRDPATLVTLARAAARIALGYPWLFELPAARIEALLVAVGRSVAPGFARGRVDGISERFVAEYEAPIAKAMPRKVRKQLEETLAGVSAGGDPASPIDAAAFVDALVDGELRLAWSLVGGLPAFGAGTTAAARLADPRFHALVRFAATREGAAWARRLGGLD